MVNHNDIALYYASANISPDSKFIEIQQQIFESLFKQLLENGCIELYSTGAEVRGRLAAKKLTNNPSNEYTQLQKILK